MAEFPPPSLRGIIEEVTGLLKEKQETISVAETVRLLSIISFLSECNI